MLLQGEGVEKAPQAARRWIELAAEAGNDKAQLALGVLLIDFDPVTAIDWYKQAVSQGNPYAAHNLALVYFEGSGVQVDLMQALAYANTSIELGNTASERLYQQIFTEVQHTTIIVPHAKPQPLSVIQSESGQLDEKNLQWLKTQPANDYTVQLARLNSHKSAVNFIQEKGLLGIAYAVALDLNDYVVLLKQGFGDRAAAQNAIQVMLPQSLKNEAWVRSYRSFYTH